MPLYEYECKECHRRTEKIQKFSDAELTVCPHCGGSLERTITAPAIQFKGAGWYKDLYSSAKPAAAAGGEGPAAPTGNEPAAPAAAKADSTTPAASTSTPAPAGNSASSSN